MKVFNRLKVASYNFNVKSKYFFSLICYLTFIISVVFITAIISASITNYYNKQINGDMYDCRISYHTENVDNDRIIEAVSKINGLSAPVVSSVISVPESSGNKMDDYINLERVTLKTEDNEYKGFDDRTFRFKDSTKKHAELGVNCFLEGCRPFSDIQKNVFGFYNNGSELIVAGREMSEENEMMMSDYIISHFGITDYSQVLNKKVTLYIDDAPYLSDYVLTGIVDSDFYKIIPDGMFYDTGAYTSQVLICCSADTISSLGANELRADFYPQDYSNLPDVIKSINERHLSDELEYESSAGSRYLLTSNVKRISGFIIFLLVLFIALAMGMQIVSVSSNDMKKQEKYYAMLRAIGIKKKELFGIVIAEHTITLIVASFIALMFSVLFLFLSDRCFAKMLGDGIDVSATQFIRMSAMIVPLAAASYLLLIFVIFAFEQRRTIHEMLK